jgi:thiol-disulfide isomerase/thioredoxin
LGVSSTAWAGEWSLKDKDGAHYKLNDLRGKWVLVNFWAPWCPPCVLELPELEALQKQHREIQILAVAVQYNSRQEVLDTATGQAVTFPIILGNEDTAAEFGGLDGLPTSFLYDPTGKLIGHHDGPLTQKEIENVMTQKPGATSLFDR